MHRYVIKRLLMMIPVLLGVTLLVFIMLEITPGDPARQILGEMATEEMVEELREEMGLNDPFVVRYVRYVWGVIHGDFGDSYMTGRPVFEEVVERFPTSLKLAALGTLIAVLVGVPLGILSAIKQYSWMDTILVGTAMVGVSMPSFWLGLILILVFSVQLQIFPSSGLEDGWLSWVMPAITIGYISAASIFRMTRSSMLEVIRQDYIRTARAKGQKETKVITKHALKNAVIPIVTMDGRRFGSALGGSVITEQVFSIPGLGQLMVNAINNRNYPVVQGGVLLIALSYSVINLLVDILYAYADPRIKAQYSVKKVTASKRTPPAAGKEAAQQ